MDLGKNTSKDIEETNNNTKDYVSGDRIPSSIDHKFNNTESNTNKENTKDNTQNKSNK